MKIYVDKNALQDYTTKLIAKEKTIFATKNEVGAPLVASTVAAMTDHDKIYVYVGSETGYTAGNWYYWNGTAWTSGGVYNSEGFELDDTLTSATLPAQGKAVGDNVFPLKAALIPSGLMQINFILPSYYFKTDEEPININAPFSGGTYFDCTYLDCNPGDKFTVSGSTALASGVLRSAIWTFIDEDGMILSQETELEIQNKIITAPTGAVKLVLNNRKLSTPNAKSYYGSWDQEIENEIEDLRSDMSQYAKGHLGKNKFYGIGLVSGYLDSATIIKPSTGSIDYKTTDYYDVSDYTVRTVDGVTARWISISPRLRMWAEYKADKTPNTSAADSGYHNPGAFVSGEDAELKLHNDTVYIRVTLNGADIDAGLVQFEDNNVCTTYEEPTMVFDEVYGLNEHQKETVMSIVGKDNLYGKKWAVCGDSFSAGDFSRSPTSDYIITSGKYAGQKKVYSYLIGNRTGMEIQMLAVNGATIAMPPRSDPEQETDFINAFSNTENTGEPTTPGGSLICHNYTEIASDADYITLYYGINDVKHEAGEDDTGDGEDTTGVITLGTITDTTTATFYGAWNVVLKWIRENRPLAHVGIIVSNGTGSESYVTAIREVAKKWGYPTIDLNGDERTPAMIRAVNSNLSADALKALLESQAVRPYTEGGINFNRHPNAAAHEFESYFIEAFLRSI